MTGLRSYSRDARILESAGDAVLAPPSTDEVLDLTRTHLARSSSTSLTECRWTYARWKPGTSLTTAYEVRDAEGVATTIVLKRFRSNKVSHLADFAPRASDQSPDSASLHPFCAIPEAGGYLSTYPFDRNLPGLVRVHDMRRTLREIRRSGFVQGYDPRPGPSRLLPLRYKPERRAVLRLDLAMRPEGGGKRVHRQVAVRVLPPKVMERVVRARQTLQSNTDWEGMPRMLACEERTGQLFEEWLVGNQVSSFAEPHAKGLGEILARLHDAPGFEGAPVTSPPEPESELFEFDGNLRRLAADLPAAPKHDEADAWVHGDVHPDQVLEVKDGLKLLDWDSLGAGLAVEDLASWIADAVADQPSRSVLELAAPFLMSYGESGGTIPPRVDLELSVAQALARLAAGSLRRLEQDAIGRASLLLERAVQIAKGTEGKL